MESNTIAIPMEDIRCSWGNFSNVELKKFLEKDGFVFEGEVDKHGRQSAQLPEEWTKKVKSEKNPITIIIMDNLGNARLEVRSKIPWGNHDFIHFSIIYNRTLGRQNRKEALLPVLDAEYSRCSMPLESAKMYISKFFGFVFTGEVGDDGMQKILIPRDWNVKMVDASTHWSYVDAMGTERMFVKKVGVDNNSASYSLVILG